MRIVYMGTPDFARSILEGILAEGYEVVGVVTQPDKPTGRKRILTPPPVKECAIAHGIPVYQPETLKNGAFADTLAELNPDIILVAAYGKILPGYILEYPKYGCINVHASLLPRHRGAAPIQRAIMEGDTTSGVTIMYMEAGLDTGDMLLKIETPITENDDYGTLHDKLARDGQRVLSEVLAKWKTGETLVGEKQDDALATYAAKIENADCVLDFSAPAKDVYNRIRALSPAPLAVAVLPDGRKFKPAAARLSDATTDATPGTVIAADKTGIQVACGDGVIVITEAQPEGKKRMKAADLVNGRAIATGDVLTKAEL